MPAFEPTCAQCQVTLEAGFALDYTHGAQVAQQWVSGSPEPHRVLGMKTGFLETKDRSKVTLSAYRCPKCYRVEWYAPPQVEEAVTTLLRPAEGADVQGLLRPAEVDGPQTKSVSTPEALSVDESPNPTTGN